MFGNRHIKSLYLDLNGKDVIIQTHTFFSMLEGREKVIPIKCLKGNRSFLSPKVSFKLNDNIVDEIISVGVCEEGQMGQTQVFLLPPSVHWGLVAVAKCKEGLGAARGIAESGD